MAKNDWERFDAGTAFDVPAKPEQGLWTLARGRLIPPTVLRVTADGKWTFLADLKPCGPGGLQRWPFGQDQLLCKKARPGALIAKVGGSDSSADDGDVYVIGTFAVLTLDKSAGPLYFTINDVPGFYDDNSGYVRVTIG
jgi:PA-IL-like protein